MLYCEVVSEGADGTNTKLVYAGTPREAMETAQAYGLPGRIVEVRMLMLESVWIPPEAMPPGTDVPDEASACSLTDRACECDPPISVGLVLGPLLGFQCQCGAIWPIRFDNPP